MGTVCGLSKIFLPGSVGTYIILYGGARAHGALIFVGTSITHHTAPKRDLKKCSTKMRSQTSTNVNERTPPL